MTFSESISTCYRKYASISGRATRSEYWWFYLFTLLASFVLGFILGFLSVAGGSDLSLLISVLISFFIFTIPQFTAGIRRLHDTGRSGWNYLWTLIPFIGGLIVLYFLIEKSDEIENDYGPAPSDVEE